MGKKTDENRRDVKSIIISGGGTGGHIYPAIAIANEIKNRLPYAKITFVGAQDRMEMEKVPKAGYSIEGLWITGFQRKLTFHNLLFPVKLITSVVKSFQILKKHKPDFVVGTGGFASGPLLYVASLKGIPIYVQEQNSLPGITNKKLSSKAAKIFVAYPGLEKYFPKSKIVETGNPIRSKLFTNLPSKKEALAYFGLENANRKVILSVGGSLGARTLNNTWKKSISNLVDNQLSLIWQSGKLDYQNLKTTLGNLPKNIKLTEFIYDMKMGYAAADIIVSRAGAMAISELCLIGKPTLLIPYPYAAEDHQTQNALSLVEKKAALMIKNENAEKVLLNQILELINQPEKLELLAKNIKALGKPNATSDIVDEIIN